MRKWTAVSVFASLSIYTSFFTYYDTLATNSQGKSSHDVDKAVVAHQRLVSDVYTPLEEKLITLQSQVTFYENAKIKEMEGNGLSGEKGFGAKARSFAEEAQKADYEASELKPIVDSIGTLFKQDTSKIVSEKILENDRKALAAVPKKYLPKKYQNKPDLERADYVDEETTVKLLEPFHKVKRGEPPAIASLMIATMVDGMVIMLGTAIEPRRRNAPFEVPAQFFSSVILGIKNACATVIKAFDKSAHAYIGLRADETIGLRGGVDLVTLRLKGRGSDFLEEFYHAIDPKTGIIDFIRLQENANTTFAIGYRMLLDELRNPRLQLVKIEADQWCIVMDYYSPLMSWLREEMLHQGEQEEEPGIPENFYATSRNVKIRIPQGR